MRSSSTLPTQHEGPFHPFFSRRRQMWYMLDGDGQWRETPLWFGGIRMSLSAMIPNSKSEVFIWPKKERGVGERKKLDLGYGTVLNQRRKIPHLRHKATTKEERFTNFCCGFLSQPKKKFSWGGIFKHLSSPPTHFPHPHPQSATMRVCGCVHWKIRGGVR